MTERDEPVDRDPVEAVGEHDKSWVDRARGSGVGVEDPNIVGDVGPTDVPPGQDPEGGLVVEEPLGGEVPPQETPEEAAET